MLIHGLTETKTEDTYEMVLDVINNKLNIKISQKGIGRSHKLGKQKGPGQKPRAIIESLHDTGTGIMSLEIKKLLKGTGISVTGSLTLKRMEHLKKARKQHGVVNIWTLDGKIMFKGNDGNPKVYYS